jgi:cell division protein FtsQ
VIGGGRQQAATRRGGPGVARGRSGSARRARRRRLPRPGPRAVGAIVVVLALGAGGWMWLRNSSLVAVQRVTVSGVSGPDAGQIRSALISAAHNMTTMNVKMGALRTAVQPFPVVKQLHVSTAFPHGMRIAVSEQVPVAMIGSAGGQTAVAGDGTLLHDAQITTPLPTIPVAVAPGGTRVIGATLAVVRLLSAAPYQLLAKISQAVTGGAHGLTAQVRNGPKLYFGDGSELSAKWAAAAAVLAAPGSAGADYVDVTVPSRPAAGVGSDAAGAPAGSGTTAASGAPTVSSNSSAGG